MVGSAHVGLTTEDTAPVKALPPLFAAVLLMAVQPSPAHALDLNPLSAIKSAIEATVEDRSAGDIATDTKIKAKIVANVIDKMGTDVIGIDAIVYEQDVLLTGIVDTLVQKTRAATLTLLVDGVKKIHNEIKVKKDVDKQKGAVEGFVDDTVVETKVNALLLDAQGVNVTNFRWNSVHGHVFMFGRALSGKERTKALALVKDIEGVSQVTNRVKVRPKKP